MTAQEKKNEHAEKHADSKGHGSESVRTEATAGFGKLSGDRKALVQFLKNGGTSGISLDFGKPELVDSKKAQHKETADKHGTERVPAKDGHHEKSAGADIHHAAGKPEQANPLSQLKGLDKSNGELQIGDQHYAVRDGQLHRQHKDAHGKQAIDEKSCGQIADGGKVKFQDGKTVDLNHTDSLVNLTDSHGGHHRILSAGGKQIDLDGMKKDVDTAVKNSEADREHYNKGLTFTAGVGEFLSQTIGGGGTLKQAIDTTVDNVTGQQQRIHQMEQDLLSGKVSGQDLAKMATKLTMASSGIDSLSHEVKQSTKSAGEAQKSANELTIGTVAAVATAGVGAIATEAMIGGAAAAETVVAAGAAEAGVTAAGEVSSQLAAKAAERTLTIGQSMIKGAVEGATKGAVEGVGKMDSESKPADVVAKVVHSGIEGALSAGAGEKVEAMLSKGGKAIADAAHEHVDDAMKGLSAAQRHIARQAQEAKDAIDGAKHLAEMGGHKAAKKAAEKATEITYKKVVEGSEGEHGAGKEHHEAGKSAVHAEHFAPEIAEAATASGAHQAGESAGHRVAASGESAGVKPDIVASAPRLPEGAHQPGAASAEQVAPKPEVHSAHPDVQRHSGAVAGPEHISPKSESIASEAPASEAHKDAGNPVVTFPQEQAGYSGPIEDMSPQQIRAAVDSFEGLDDVAHILTTPAKEVDFSAGAEATLARASEPVAERGRESSGDASKNSAGESSGRESFMKLLEQNKIAMPSSSDQSQMEQERAILKVKCESDSKDYDELRKRVTEKNGPLIAKVDALEANNKENKTWVQICGGSERQSYNLAESLQRVGIGSADLFVNRPEFPKLDLANSKTIATVQQAIDKQPGLDAETKENLKSELGRLQEKNEAVEQSNAAVADFVASGKSFLGADGKPMFENIGGLSKEQLYNLSQASAERDDLNFALAKTLASSGIDLDPAVLSNSGRSHAVKLDSHQDFEKVRSAINSSSLGEEQRQWLKDQLVEVKIAQERENQIVTNDGELTHLRKQLSDNAEPLRKPYDQLKDERQALAEIEAHLRAGSLAGNLDAIDSMTAGNPKLRDSIYESLGRIARPSDAVQDVSGDLAPAVSPEQRLQLMADLARQIAHPETIKQGDKKTCGLAESEFELATHHPDLYAKYVADLVSQGSTKLFPYEGAAGASPDDNLGRLKINADLIHNNTKPFDNDNPDRSLASKVFQTATADWIAYKDSKGSYEDSKFILKSSVANSGIDARFEKHGGEEVTRQDGTTYEWDGVRGPGIAELTSRLTGDKYKPVILSQENLTGDRAQMEKVKADFYDVLKNQQFPIKVGMCLTKGDFTGMNAVDGHELAITGVDKEKDLVYIYNTAMPTDAANPYVAVKTEDLLYSMYRNNSTGDKFSGTLIVKE